MHNIHLQNSVVCTLHMDEVHAENGRECFRVWKQKTTIQLLVYIVFSASMVGCNVKERTLGWLSVVVLKCFWSKKKTEFWRHCSGSWRSLIFTKEKPFTHHKSFQISLWEGKSTNENITLISPLSYRSVRLNVEQMEISVQVTCSSDILRKTPWSKM